LGKRGPSAARAVLALGSAGRATKAVARDLRAALRDRDEDVRFSAVLALERYRRSGDPGR